MKKINRGSVLKEIVLSHGTTRVELTKKLSLSKMTITNIIAEFLEKGFVEEKEKLMLGVAHKNPIRLEISGNCPKIIGVQIQRSYCKAVLTDFYLNILESREVYFDSLDTSVLKDTLEKLIRELVKSGNVLGIGIGSIGPIDTKKGVICNPLDFGEIKDFAIVDYLKEKFQMPVVLEHHYNCALLAEHYFGDAKDIGNIIYLGITRGVGMGGMIDKRLYSDFFGCITEIGHVSIENNGRLCRCGNRGCLETYVSTDVMLKELKKLTGKEMTFQEFCAHTEDCEIMNYFYSIMRYLRNACVSCVNMFKPQMIILGDEGIYLPDACVAYLEEELNRFHMYQGDLNVKIRKTSIKSPEILTASAAMGLMEKVFQGELLFE